MSYAGPAERFEKWGGPIGELKLRGSEATKPEGAKLPRGEGVGGGRELFHFSTWKCAILGMLKKEIST